MTIVKESKDTRAHVARMGLMAKSMRQLCRQVASRDWPEVSIVLPVCCSVLQCVAVCCNVMQCVVKCGGAGDEEHGASVSGGCLA